MYYIVTDEITRTTRFMHFQLAHFTCLTVLNYPLYHFNLSLAIVKTASSLEMRQFSAYLLL